MVHPVTGETLCISENFIGTKEIEKSKIDDLIQTVIAHKNQLKESDLEIKNYYCSLRFYDVDSIYTFSSTDVKSREQFEPIKKIRALLK